MEWLHQSEFIKGVEKQCPAQLCKLLCRLHPSHMMHLDHMDQLQQLFLFGVRERLVLAALAEFAIALFRGDWQQTVDCLKLHLLSFGECLRRREFDAVFFQRRLKCSNESLRLGTFEECAGCVCFHVAATSQIAAVLA